MRLRFLPELFSLFLLLGLCGLLPAADDPPTGLQAEVKIKDPTRLDWQFVASGFGAQALKLPPDYDSRQQKFQLYVPRNYTSKKDWPLMVFISPGDDPMGWKFWQKTCETQGMLFCAAYGAGNNCPPGKRIRMVLDMFDQVRRTYQIDPQQTYVTGFSGGGRVACTVGYNLPEYFGGIIPICGTNPMPSLTYIRHRVRDRLSVAFVTGETDFNRDENEKYMAPYIAELGIRSKLWVVPKLGHGIPGQTTLDEVVKWLQSDVERRKTDVKNRPKLSVPPDNGLAPSDLAQRMLEAGEESLKKDETVWSGVALLQGVNSRWPKTEAGGKAEKQLKALLNDARKVQLIEDQGGKEERAGLKAQATALERFNQLTGAIQAWQTLAEDYPNTPDGRKAADEVKRLTNLLAAKPFLGVTFGGDGNVVDRLVPEGPADKAGLRSKDKVLTLGGTPIKNAADLKKQLDKHKPGDKVKVEVERDGKKITLQLEIGSAAPMESK